MPTTWDEADKIIAVCKRHNVQPEQLHNLTRDLHYEVGQSSSNASVSETLKMLYVVAGRNYTNQLSEKVAGKKEYADAGYLVVQPGELALFTGWAALTLLHGILWCALITAALVVPFVAHWTVAVLLLFCAGSIAFSQQQCPLTTLENMIRRRLGWPQIDHFGPHVFRTTVLYISPKKQ